MTRARTTKASTTRASTLLDGRASTTEMTTRTSRRTRPSRRANCIMHTEASPVAARKSYFLRALSIVRRRLRLFLQNRWPMEALRPTPRLLWPGTSISTKQIPRSRRTILKHLPGRSRRLCPTTPTPLPAWHRRPCPHSPLSKRNSHFSSSSSSSSSKVTHLPHTIQPPTRLHKVPCLIEHKPMPATATINSHIATTHRPRLFLLPRPPHLHIYSNRPTRLHTRPRLPSTRRRQRLRRHRTSRPRTATRISTRLTTRRAATILLQLIQPPTTLQTA